MWIVLIVNYAVSHLELTVEVLPRLNHIRDQKSHKDRGNISSGSSNERTFIVGSKTVNLSSGTFVLTQEESVVKGEILQALQYVECNYSFASGEKDSEIFKAMFPDSEIASNYRQGETKFRYNIQFGIGLYIKDSHVKDFSDCPFSFKFDETITSKV